MRALMRENPDEWAKAMCESADDTARKARILAQKVNKRIQQSDKMFKELEVLSDC